MDLDGTLCLLSSACGLVAQPRLQTFDAMTHFSWEAIFLWNSIGGRMAFTEKGLLVSMGTFQNRIHHLWLLTFLPSQGIRSGRLAMGTR